MPNNTSLTTPITAVIVGAGHRAIGLGRRGQQTGGLKVVGVAEPREIRRDAAAEEFGIPAEKQWETAEHLAQIAKQADVVINGTMDAEHVPTSVPLLERGYDMLLEKPFATNVEEMWRLVHTARQHRRKVMICHVLRYAPFYASIRKKVLDGEIGDIKNVQAVEHVSYHHMHVAFIHGKWNQSRRIGSTMLMSKSCHDLDLIAWMKSGVRPVRVSSFGGNMQFTPDRAPEGAGTRCMVDCPVEPDCDYSAKKLYVDHPDRWGFYVWEPLEHIKNPTIEDKIHSMKTDNPWGRCAWKSDMDVVDHQSVAVDFADGSTATFNMIGGTARAMRSIHLIGTEGEIQGTMDESRWVVRHIDHGPGREYTEEAGSLDIDGDTSGKFGGGHGGGDERLVADFIRVIRGEAPSISTTDIEDSVSGHLMGFCADLAREEGRVVDVPWEG